jgi:hypothetical protein
MGTAVYRWNAALNRWTECHAVFFDASRANAPHFTPLLLSQVAILSTKPSDEVGKGHAARSSPQINSTKFPLIKGSKNVGFHPLRAISRAASANSTNKGHRDTHSQSPSPSITLRNSRHLVVACHIPMPIPSSQVGRVFRFRGHCDPPDLASTFGSPSTGCVTWL